MSTGDYIGIWRRGGRYRGYILSNSDRSSVEDPRKGRAAFVVLTLTTAILEAQSIDTEYGYYFYSL